MVRVELSSLTLLVVRVESLSLTSLVNGSNHLVWLDYNYYPLSFTCDTSVILETSGAANKATSEATIVGYKDVAKVYQY